MGLPLMLGWYDRRLMRPLYESLPKTGEVFCLGDGLYHAPGKWDALNELARRDGYRLECVGYSGLLDYQLVPIRPPMDVAARATTSSTWPCRKCGAPMKNAGGDDWACTQCSHTEWRLRD